MNSSYPRIVTFLWSLSSLCYAAVSFTPIATLPERSSTQLYGVNPGGKASKLQKSKLMGIFSTYSGEVLNPYVVLKVDRGCDISEIKRSYRELSKRYHPDGVRHKELLPGTCSNLDDVRSQWERIRMAYEILSDKDLRRKYDTREALSDPGAALTRATLSMVGKVFKGVGKGLLSVGGYAIGGLSQVGQGTNEVQSTHMTLETRDEGDVETC
jgi:DnaJ-class molecular chaperone